MFDEKYAFTDRNIGYAPASAGVYALFDNGAVIYIGRAQGGSVTIRSRLRDHKGGREGSCTRFATHYWREATSSSVKREKELLEQYKKGRGRLPRCNDRIG